MKRWISVIGIILTIIGWVLSNGNVFSFVLPTFTPKYVKAISAFNKMHQLGYVLKYNDSGFSEISDIICNKYIDGRCREPKAEIAGISTITGGINILKDHPFLRLSISFSNGQQLNGYFYDLKSDIEKKYLTHTMFFWNSIIFWLGIVITIIGLLNREK